jgi:hypothetical protein
MPGVSGGFAGLSPAVRVRSEAPIQCARRAGDSTGAANTEGQTSMQAMGEDISGNGGVS